MTTFAYPKIRHARTQNPPQYSNYRSFKPHLQKEFARTCVYCRQPDSVAPGLNFTVDHYKPQSKFPEEATNYDNLYYCCPACNSRKKDHWPNFGGTSTRFIPNPCDHVMFDHLRFNNDRVVPRTEPGIFTTEKLDLNDPKVVDYRAFIFRMIDMLNGQRLEYQAAMRSIVANFKAGKITEQQAEEGKNGIDLQIAEIDADIAKFSGTTPI